MDTTDRTPDRIRAHLALYPRATMKEVADSLGRSPHSIRITAIRHGIQFKTMRKTYAGKVGEVCPGCGETNNGVKDSRPFHFLEIPAVMRRRLCESCGLKFTTFEVSEVALRESMELGEIDGVVEENVRADERQKVIAAIEALDAEAV